MAKTRWPLYTCWVRQFFSNRTLVYWSSTLNHLKKSFHKSSNFYVFKNNKFLFFIYMPLTIWHFVFFTLSTDYYVDYGTVRATVVKRNYRMKNGVIHLIDRVLYSDNPMASEWIGDGGGASVMSSPSLWLLILLSFLVWRWKWCWFQSLVVNAFLYNLFVWISHCPLSMIHFMFLCILMVSL